MQFNESQIEELFSQKTSRAVDRVFTENKLDGIHSLFVSLQETKKLNTHALRNSLSKNYEKMLYCSELIEGIKDFAGSINVIADKINEEMNKQLKEKQNWKEKDVIGHIETKMRNQQFKQAMQICMNPPLTANDCDRYYIEYLKIEIIESLEKYLKNNNLCEKVIEEAYECLKQFMMKTDKDQILAICSDYHESKLLGILQRHIEDNNEALQIIFKFKLSLLRRCSNKQTLSNYFKDLCLLLENKNSSVLNCNKIFKCQISTIKEHLTQIFVYKQSDGLVKFRSQIYDELLKSEEFSSILNDFHAKISHNLTENSIDNPIKYLHELWNNYILNLVDYLTEQINPIVLLDLLKEENQENVPIELQIYMYDYSVDLSVQIYTRYEEKFGLFVKNIIETIQRCNREEKERIKERFTFKINEIQKECSKTISKLIEEKSKIAFRKYIVFILCCELFTRQISSIELLSSNNFDEWKESSVSSFWELFKKNKLTQDLLEFDKFFIGYIEQLKKDKGRMKLFLYILRWIVENILSYLMAIEKGKDLENVKHTLASIKEKKQKITIREIILVPYTAKYIFDCEMKENEIDQHLFKKYFTTHKKNIEIIETNEEEEDDDDFEIGQKETSQEVFKIGKSLMNIGGNLISGIIPKMPKKK